LTLDNRVPHALTLIGLGSNLKLKSDRLEFSPEGIIAHSLGLLESMGFIVCAVSSIWRSPAWPPGRQAHDYANAVALIDAKGSSPHQQLANAQAIETAMGRLRDGADQWAPRTLDIDLLDCGGMVLDTPDLVLPHPRMGLRAFVLGPLLEIMPNWRNPASDMSGRALLDRLRDQPGAEGTDARAARPVTVPLRA
jgi:2-amino-4-hydroxy-6-hydroxymethyldihydropteridine diphosphokinase